jgi:UDP-2-acetamido-3-amino-2,3-dideoxy-glucuronate N-acetyltransferase
MRSSGSSNAQRIRRRRSEIVKGRGGARIRVALVGHGRWGTNVARDLSRTENAVLTHIADIDEGARFRASRACPSATVVSSFEESLDEVDAVAICTPASSHVSIAEAALSASKHVFVEKPIAMNTASAEQLASLSERESRVLMVGHQMLYHPSFERLLRGVASGELGALRGVRAERFGVVDPARDPDVLWAYGPHDVAMVAALMGAVPCDVRAVRVPVNMGGEGGAVSLSFIFASDVVCTVTLRGDSPLRVRRFAAVCERGEISFDDAGTDSPLASELADFVACCAAGTHPRADGPHAVYVTRLLEAAERARDEGRTFATSFSRG